MPDVVWHTNVHNKHWTKNPLLSGEPGYMSSFEKKIICWPRKKRPMTDAWFVYVSILYTVWKYNVHTEFEKIE